MQTLSQKTHHTEHQWLVNMGTVILDFQNCCNRDGNTIFKYMNYVPIVVVTDLEVHFSVLKKGCPNTFVYIVYVQVIGGLVMSFYSLHLQSHQRC